MSKELSRHEIREKALQALFPLDFNADLTKQDAIMNAIELDYQEMINEEENEFIPGYLDMLVGGVLAQKEQLDTVIKGHLRSNWNISRLAKMDLVILRLAIFEMTYVDNIPDKVVLNEALELAKTFSDDQSRKFINGILSNVMKDLEAEE